MDALGAWAVVFSKAVGGVGGIGGANGEGLVGVRVFFFLGLVLCNLKSVQCESCFHFFFFFFVRLGRVF